MTWKSHRGDEWWYSGPIGKVEGSCDGRSFSIGAIPKGMHGYRNELVHGFLFETFNMLKEFTIRLSYSKDIEAVLQDLASQSNVIYEAQKTRYGSTLILKNVMQPKAQLVFSPPPKTSWWRWW